ncbi:hypothetical protein BPNPMPFG_004433 [Mesorhizobium sp. AR07]|uniref:hypothetical protein n=1 Tax=Mesorhizobium sp. AR07 TaxID=2865838 RepID=UPI00215EDF18|nr:hypothetical protein [Mesorhizobium sp. AR07]UVK42724.1 hypothetical protein BPNPMPFG_004433 [Mesorhizobium sp. AR07]
MKRRLFLLTLAIVLPGCQTGQVDGSSSPVASAAGGKKTQNKLTKPETACAEAAQKAAQAQTNAALLGGVLSMAGGSWRSGWQWWGHCRPGRLDRWLGAAIPGHQQRPCRHRGDLLWLISWQPCAAGQARSRLPLPSSTARRPWR